MTEKTTKKRAEIIRYENNPFTEDMVIPVKERQVKLSKLGKDENILINQETGEVLGTHLTTYKKVDSDQFIKLFTANIALTFDLNAAGIKAFNVLIWTLQNKALSKDLVPLDKYTLNEFLEGNSHISDKKGNKLSLSLTTFGRGLSELESAKIIAKHLRQGWYFINPNFLFNGDRIAFTTVIERKAKAEKTSKEKLEDHGQESLIP